MRRFVLLFAALATAALVVAAAFLLVTERAIVAPSQAGVLTIRLTGHPWWWQVDYPDQQFTTANEIRVPVNEPVVLQLASDNVLHSVRISPLRVKLDLTPGKTNVTRLEATQAGIWRGECEQACGAQYAHMNLDVTAVSQADFDAWVRAEQAVPPVPAAGDPHYAGLQTFLGSACVYCHTIRGTNASGQVGPDLTHVASRPSLGAGTLPNTRGNLAGWIIDSQHIKPGNKMPPMYMDGPELQPLLDYLETLQ